MCILRIIITRFSDAQVEEIKKLRENGKTIKEIATMFECSVGLIHKLINEKNSYIDHNIMGCIYVDTYEIKILKECKDK